MKKLIAAFLNFFILSKRLVPCLEINRIDIILVNFSKARVLDCFEIIGAVKMEETGRFDRVGGICCASSSCAVSPPLLPITVGVRRGREGRPDESLLSIPP